MMYLRVRPTLLSDTPASNGGGLSFLPLALARVHWSVAVDTVLDLDVPDDPRVAELLVGAGFEVESLQGETATVRRLRTLPDTVGPAMRALVCGLNPSLAAADAGYGYAGPSNRFWKAAVAAGLVTKPRDPVHALEVDGVGMTDLVKRATPSAASLTPDEYRQGVDRVRRLVEWLQPARVVFVGLTGWRTAVDRRATAGWQPHGFGGVPAYVMPSTSGLNAHATPALLADHMRAAGSSARFA